MTSMREKIGGVILLGLMKRDSYDVVADAVLDALMEPTEGMLDAAGGAGAPSLKRAVFTAMVTAAKEGK